MPDLLRAIALSRAFSARDRKHRQVPATQSAEEPAGSPAVPSCPPTIGSSIQVNTLSRLRDLTRRRFLRGMLNGGAVTLGLPLLNCFLNGNGTALAAAAPLPVRFGTWFWGLGMNAKIFVPTKVGADYDLPEELSALSAMRKHVNLFTNFNAMRDSAPNLCHYTGWIIMRSGSAPHRPEDRPGETIDVTVSRDHRPHHALPDA